MIRRPRSSTRTDTLFPDAMLFRSAWPDRAFRRLQANGEALDGARDLIERNPAPFEEGRSRRFFGGLFSIRVIPGDGTIGRACRGRCRDDAFDGVRHEPPTYAPTPALDIGRASGREWVFTYVLIWVVAF